MPQRGDIPINNFVRGLVTEASPLTFPLGASLDEVNFELLRDGSRRRRLGLDLEDNYGLLSSGLGSAVLEGARCQAYRWSIPNGNIDQDIGVVQIGNQIWFLDLYTANPSANILNGGNPIVATELNNDVIMTFTTLNNYLIGVANHLPQPYLFNYDPATDTVTVETAAIAIRDMWGVDDGLAVDGRPTALTPAHHYNLLNQGWLPDIQSTCGAGINAIDCTFNTFGIYPSNSDAWTYGRVEDLTSVDVKKFDPNIAGRNFVNNGNVARGHFIINLYDRGSSRSAQTGFTLPVDRETGRINAIAAFAGRIFYAGILSKVVGGDSRSPNLSGTVLFSQLFENKLNLVKCYQEADPTSPDINDIVDTDGGLIQIPECSYIFALKAIKESLFVFAANGVWEIRGGDNGFTATSFMVHKISNVGVYAPKSIVEVEGIIYFWAATGIHAIGRNENGVFQTTNLTIPTIQTLYNAIPDASKKNARGYYDLAQNRARWLYYSPETKEFGEAIDIDEVPAESYSTVGSPVTITSINSVRIDIAALTSSSAMVTYVDGSTNALRVRMLTIDDLTVTTGTDQNPGVANVFSTTSVCRLTDTTTLVTYLTSGNLIGCRVLTVSGGTVTAGSQTTFACIAGSVPKVETVSSTQCIVAYRNPAGNVAARSLSISGTTITAGAEVVVSVNTTVNYQNVISISSSSAIVSYLDSTANYIKTRVVTISGSTLAVLGTEYNVSANGATTSQFTEVKMKNSTIGIVTWVDAGSIIKSTPIAISGTVVTTGTIHSYSRNGSVFSHYYLPSGKSVMMYTNTSDNFPDMLVSTVSSSLIVEGSNSDLNNELSFELALDKLDNSRVIMIYRSFSGGLILALAARV